VAPGFLVALEGLDGSGKSTAARSVATRLRSEGWAVTLTREPGGTEVGAAIRSLIFANAETMSATTELLLMCADRAEHVRSVIGPALENGDIVITDRFFASTIAYQGYGGRLDLETVDGAIRIATGGLTPDLTILFDVDLDTAHSRRAVTGQEVNALDTRREDFRVRVRDGYQALASGSPDWVTIDAGAPPESVADSAYTAILTALELRRSSR